MRALNYPHDLIAPPSLAPDNHPAIYDAALNRWISYGTLRGDAARIAQKFAQDPAQHATQSKKLVFIFAQNNYDTLVSYLGAAMAGHAIALLDGAMQEESRRVLIQTYRPAFIYSPRSKEKFIAFDKAEPNDIHPDLFLLLSTSGSTGSAKFVRLSYNGVASNVMDIIISQDLNPSVRAMAHLPLSYSFGLSVVHSMLAIGGSIVLSTSSMMQPDFWRVCREEHCSLIPCVPLHCEMMHKLNLDRLNVPDLRLILQAGGHCDEKIIDGLASTMRVRGGRLLVMYGQTEAGPRMTTLPAEKFADKHGATGRALSSGKLSIIDENGKPCPPDVIGEIVYEGPNVMMGYAAGHGDLALGDDMRGRLVTGDLGYLDSEGYLFITGRLKRVAKLHGLRVALDEVEHALASVAPCVAVEKNDKIILVTASNDADTHDRLLDAARKKFDLPPHLLTLRSVAAIPYNSQGKIDYPRLTALL